MLTFTMTGRIVGTGALVTSLALSGCGGGGATGTMPPDPADLAEPAALANAIDLVANDERKADGKYIGSWNWVSGNTDGGTYAVINQTHQSGEHVWSAIVWHDENGELQHLVTVDQNDVDTNQLLSSDPYVSAGRYISTSEDIQDQEGFTTFRRSVSDHDLGSVWQVTELMNDYDSAGTWKVHIATDLTETDMARSPYAGEGEVAVGGKIEFQGIPSLPVDRDYLYVWLAGGDRLAGSFGGVAGKFSCANSDGCGFYTIHRAASGYYTAADNVFFTPGGGPTQAVPPEALDAEAAADYLAFGHWLYVPEDVTRTDAYQFGVFGSGGESFETANIAGLTGTATYTGDAEGLYYVNSWSQSPVTGSFTADIVLTADFGTDSEWGTVSGEVSNFSFDGNVAAMFPETWELETNVYLGYRNNFAVHQGERNIFYSYPHTSGVHAGGLVIGYTRVEDFNGETWYGGWNAKLFGNGALATDHPTSIAGTLNTRQFHDTGTRYIDAFHGAEIVLSGSFGVHKKP